MELSKRDKYYFYNTLASIPKGLEGDYTMIDLRNESCAIGKIKWVDADMNIDLIDATFYDSRGIAHNFEYFFINGRQVRYIHIPKEKPANSIAQSTLAMLQNPLRREKKAHTFKQQRAKKYQKEIIESLQTNDQT